VTLPNDWEIKNCLWLVLAILLAMLGLIGLASLGFDITILRQIISFIFLTFIPGILILRILKIHKVNIIEGLVYSVGLSLASVMFIGALTNLVLPFLGISKPISLLPVTISLTIFTLILMAAAYIRDRNFQPERTTPKIKLSLPAVLFLTLLLLLTVLSVTLIDAYQNNILLLICLIAVASVVALAAFGRFIKPEIYPLAIFIIGLCLLYQTTLMSPYLVGADIYDEYHFYQLAASSGFWDASIPSTVNSCLSITILAPAYSLLMNIDGVWIFKVVYPLFFAMVPLVLFCVFRQQISPKKAFLAAFFFVAVPTFSLEMIALARQQLAELFLALVILLLVDKKLDMRPKLTLAVIFAASIVVSHYAIGFIGFIYMGLFLPFVFMIRSGVFKRAWGWLTAKAGGLPRSLLSRQALPAKLLIIVVVVYFVAGFAWYGTVASGVNLNLLSKVWAGQTSIIATGLTEIVTQPTQSAQTTQPISFFDFSNRDPLVQTALGLDFHQASPQGKGFRILQWLIQLFLIAGCLRLVFRPKDLRFAAEYIALSLTSILLILACIFLPIFATLLNTTRIYHIALITLAPFCILGGEAIWLGVSSLWQKIRHVVPHFNLAKGEDKQGFLGFMALGILIPYFLFTSGFIYEVTGQKVTDRIDAPYSIALSSYRLDLAGVFYWQDGAAARWLAQNADDEARVYTDSHTHKLLEFYEFRGRSISLPRSASELSADSYIYCSAWNTEKKELTLAVGPGLRQYYSFEDISGLTTAIDNRSRIYNDGGAQVLR
jgi:uncharacterized membrane protein